VIPGPDQEAFPVEVSAPPPPEREVVALPVNRRPKVSFTGQQAFPADAFVLEREMLDALLQRGAAEPAKVVHPLLTSGAMLTAVGVNRWIIDIGESEDLGKYPVLMDYLGTEAQPTRQLRAEEEKEANRRRRERDPRAKLDERYAKEFAKCWTLLGPRQQMLRTVERLDRYVVTSRETRQDTPIFTFVDASICPDESLSVYALSDDYSFGVLSSEAYRAWVRARKMDARRSARRRGAAAWSSYPWPQAPEARHVSAIAELADSILTVRAALL
jgi:hypothetical protein